MTLEQQQLVSKAEENLQAARLLLSEGLHDIAVSRAYYAMFYVAEAFLLNEGISLSKHSGVIAKFGEIYAKTNRVPRDFHRNLIQAEQSRTKADYNAASKASQAEVETQIERAEEFISFAKGNLCNQ